MCDRAVASVPSTCTAVANRFENADVGSEVVGGVIGITLSGTGESSRSYGVGGDGGGGCEVHDCVHLFVFRR
jgi:hypothetical protein